MKRVIVFVLIFSLLFVPVVQAYLGAVISLGTVLRVGAIYIAQLWRNEAIRAVVRSVLIHVAAGTLAYLAYDRGTSVPPEERYITVSLAGVKSKIQSYKDAGFYPDPTWGLNVIYSVGNNCFNGIYYATNSGVICGTQTGTSTLVYDKYFRYGTYDPEGDCSYAAYPAVGSTAHNCTSTEKAAYFGSSSQLDSNATKTVDDPTKLDEVASALGSDIQNGGSLSSSVPSGAYVVQMGGDVYANTSYGDSNDFISAGSNPTGVGTSSGTEITKQEVQDAVSGALTEKLGTNPGGVTSPSYDNNYTNPTENSITDRITSFISSNPIILAIKGSRLLLSGAACTTTVGSAFEKPLTLDFCWMEDYLTMFGNVMVIFAGLTAAFIIFRRGD